MPDSPALGAPSPWSSSPSSVPAPSAKQSDATTEMVDEAREWAETFRCREHDCRIELAAVRAEVAELRQQIVILRRDVEG